MIIKTIKELFFKEFKEFDDASKKFAISSVQPLYLNLLNNISSVAYLA